VKVVKVGKLYRLAMTFIHLMTSFSEERSLSFVS
jgi:hypothetical protein